MTGLNGREKWADIKRAPIFFCLGKTVVIGDIVLFFLNKRNILDAFPHILQAIVSVE